MSSELPAAVLWDMDGTLIDSQPIWIRAQTELVAEFGGRWETPDGLSLVGVGMDVVSSRLQDAGVQLTSQQIIDRLIDRVTSALTADVPWLPGAHELVSALSAAGIPQAIVTSAPAQVVEQIRGSLTATTLRAFVAAEDVKHAKPHPEPYAVAALTLRASPERCLAIEDSPAGLASAIAAGCVVVGVSNDVPLNVAGPWTPLESLRQLSVDDLLDIFRASQQRLVS